MCKENDKQNVIIPSRKHRCTPDQESNGQCQYADEAIVKAE